MRAFIVLLVLSVLLAGCVGRGEAAAGNSTGAYAIQPAPSTQNTSQGAAIPLPPGANQTSAQPPAYNFSESRNGNGSTIVYYFYSSFACEPCEDTRQLIEGLKSAYGSQVEWREFDLQAPDQGLAYISFADYRNVTNCLRKVPAAFVNNTLLTGPIEINSSLEKAVNLSLAGRPYDFSRAYSGEGRLTVYFFYSSHCQSCKSIEPYVESIGRKYENATEWEGFDIDTGYGRDGYLQFFKDFNVSQNRAGVPTIMANRTVLWGIYEINDSLERIINASVR